MDPGQGDSGQHPKADLGKVPAPWVGIGPEQVTPASPRTERIMFSCFHCPPSASIYNKAAALAGAACLCNPRVGSASLVEWDVVGPRCCEPDPVSSLPIPTRSHPC